MGLRFMFFLQSIVIPGVIMQVFVNIINVAYHWIFIYTLDMGVM